jgi:DNA-binding response OmpR family regulator
VIDVDRRALELIDVVRDPQAAGRVDPDTPILVLTARTDELHRVRLLDRGADDVLTQPFSYPELRARLAALLRRAGVRAKPRVLRCGPLAIDLAARQARVAGHLLALSAKEYELLAALAS